MQTRCDQGPGPPNRIRTQAVAAKTLPQRTSGTANLPVAAPIACQWIPNRWARASASPRRADDARKPAVAVSETSDRRSIPARRPPFPVSSTGTRTPLSRTGDKSGASRRTRCRCRGHRRESPLISGPESGQRTLRPRKRILCAVDTQGNGTQTPWPAHQSSPPAPAHKHIERLEILSCPHLGPSLWQFAMGAWPGLLARTAIDFTPARTAANVRRSRPG